MNNNEQATIFNNTLHQSLAQEVGLSNAIVLAQKAYQIESNPEEAYDSYNKSILLIQYHQSSKSKLSCSQQQQLTQLLNVCKQRIQQLKMPKHKVTPPQNSWQSLEHVTTIPLYQDQFYFLLSKYLTIFLNGDLVSSNLYFSPELYQVLDTKYLTLYKQTTLELDKVLVLYKFTPEAELPTLLKQMKKALFVLYKQQSNPIAKLKEKFLSQFIQQDDDMLFIIQKMLASSFALFELIKEREKQSNLTIEKPTKMFIIKYFMDFIFPSLYNELKNQLLAQFN